MVEDKIITVGQLSELISAAVESYDFFSSIYVSGEIANFKHNYSSGHAYFTLKDERSQINSMIFRSAYSSLTLEPEEGMKVVAHGKLSYYQPLGRLSFIIDNIEPQGIGSLYLAFTRLKDKLQGEGLFDDIYKKEIPAVPDRVGIITARDSAALQDILNISGRRYPGADIAVYPTSVQGEDAAKQLIAGLKYFNEKKDVDVIIIGRGGGSFEDLYVFNNEELVRTCFQCEIPVVSAVGHETDFTLIDYVADLRAPTPSASAELVFPSRENMMSNISDLEKELKDAIADKILSKKDLIEACSERLSASVRNTAKSAGLKFNSGLEKARLLLINRIQILKERMSDYSEKEFEKLLLLRIRKTEENIAMLSDEIFSGINGILDSGKDRLRISAKRLNDLSPLAILSRGYSGILNSDGKSVKSIDDIKEKDKIKSILKDGYLISEVSEIGKTE